MRDMLKASALVRRQAGWMWTILRAPTLRDAPRIGYRLSGISEVTSKHRLSRDDYAVALLDSIGNPEHHRRTLTVVPTAD
jgi:putative NADH-flavin reductase